MAQTKRLPDAELEGKTLQEMMGMEGLRVRNFYLDKAEVQQHASSDWKMTSVLTFLSRLTDKGFLSCTKEGRQNLYTPLVSEEDYRQRESVGFIRRLCGGSVKNLVASLSDAGALSEQDIDELRAFLDAQEQ